VPAPAVVKRLLLVVALLVTLSALAVAAAATWFLAAPYRGYPQDEQRVLVLPGASGQAILEQLAADGVIRHPLPARLYLRWLGGPTLHAGEYRFGRPLTTLEVLDKLIRGEVVLHVVTVIEGLTLEETAQHLSASGFGQLERFLEAMRDPAPIIDLDADASDLEGYLFPDTYRFGRGTSEERIVGAMVENFRRRYRDHLEPGLPAAGERTLREVVILASIVEKEARLPAERPLIAGVFHNRLVRGIALYADPTVVFVLKQQGRWDGNIRKVDLAIDSPYNTYRNAGLPPGPICSPGLGSLQAAVVPAEVPYLYFVSRNDGSHVFATTLQEHNRNVAQWQRRYWRERREREQREAATTDPTDVR
jgi:UPF0755 protein